MQIFENIGDAQGSLTPYPEALAFMEQRVAGIIAGTSEECLWFVEHPPLYTGGTSAKAVDLLNPEFPVFETGRGGEYTYHGPGQRVVYAMLDLKKRHHNKPDLKHYVWQLEEWIIRSLAQLGIVGQRRAGRVGIWVVNADGEENKIAAIGIRVRKWVSFHGIAINMNPNLSHFGGIVPCGLHQFGVTSIEKHNVNADMAMLDAALKQQFDGVFNTVK